jgi:hypothetical protein
MSNFIPYYAVGTQPYSSASYITPTPVGPSRNSVPALEKPQRQEFSAPGVKTAEIPRSSPVHHRINPIIQPHSAFDWCVRALGLYKKLQCQSWPNVGSSNSWISSTCTYTNIQPNFGTAWVFISQNGSGWSRPSSLQQARNSTQHHSKFKQ